MLSSVSRQVRKCYRCRQQLTSMKAVTPKSTVPLVSRATVRSTLAARRDLVRALGAAAARATTDATVRGMVRVTFMLHVR